jgi:hypothetical protein
MASTGWLSRAIERSKASYNRWALAGDFNRYSVSSKKDQQLSAPLWVNGHPEPTRGLVISALRKRSLPSASLESSFFRVSSI